jgi:hypothetical protein
MIRTAWTGVLLAAAMSGCLPNNFVAPSGPADKSAKTVEPRPALAPPVTAGQITGVNAKEKADALRDEMDRDMERAIDGKSDSPKPDKK